MPEEATYEEKVQQLAQLKLKAAQAEQEVKNELKKRKAAGIDPTNQAIVDRFSAWAAAAGLLMGVPVVSGAALTAIQIRMLDQLAERFGQNYTENEARNTLYAITGGLITPLFAGAPVTAIASAIPVIGPLAGLLAGPALAAGSTRMVGRLFLEHFEKGGNVSDLDVAKAKKDYEAGLKTEAEKHAASANHGTT
ncbi:MAG: DUF697 domain-containing protein [Verrucomicrobia bacterium]|nr:DUF697 domain-containing protein [Verrucomicrobiota bacterium]